VQEGFTATGAEVFALTDEQIVGLTPELAAADEASAATRGRTGTTQGEPTRSEESPRNDDFRVVTSAEPAAAPQWLAERMNDPWCGEEAKQFWDGKQQAEREVAAYRELFATTEDARALKELYPGGIEEAKTAAERARALDEIDAAFYRGDATARMQLAKQMMEQQPAAFREMVEAGLQLLGRPAAGQAVPRAETPSAASPEVVRAYGEFERSANAELGKSVGGAIARAMEQALPNLRAMKAAGPDGAATLNDRLASAVREEVEAGLKSDRQLGDQVGRVLAGRRFDRDSRAQVVRLIDARAQQLVPGAVKRVVGSWTQTTLAAHGKEAPAAPQRTATPGRATVARAASSARRVDYGRVSDEQIVGL
jgi:hypothetical protein